MDNDPSSALEDLPELLARVRKQFEGNDSPVEVDVAADLFGILAAQQEILVAMATLMMKVDPKLVISPEMQSIRGSVHYALDTYRDSWIKFAERHAPKERDDDGR